MTFVIPAKAHGCPGKSCEGQSQLLWVGRWSGPVGFRRFVDGAQGLSGEQAVAHEPGEADRRQAGAGVPGGKAQQQEGDHRGQDLKADGRLAAPEEGAQLEVLLDPAEQQLDLPARLVQAGDDTGGPLQVVGDQCTAARK